MTQHRSPIKELWSVLAHAWTQRSYTYRKVKHASHHHTYHSREYATETVTRYAADFDVEVDVPAIIDLIVARARTSKSGKSVLLGGLATAKRRKSSVQKLSEETRELPMHDGYVLID